MLASTTHLLESAVRPSKVALVLIENSPLAAIGIDRVYMGCLRSGFLKFLLFFLVTIVPEVLAEALPVVGMLYFLWVIYDWVSVTMNALSRSMQPTLCDSPHFTGWSDDRDVILSFWFSLGLSLFELIALFAFVVTVLHYGIQVVWDGARNLLGIQRHVPSYASISDKLKLK